MSDEVDDLLRRTMATLDRQVPDGYFDTLVNRALDRRLVRLDDPALGELPDPRAARTRQAGDPTPATAATDQVAVMSGRRGPSNRRPLVAVVGLGLAVAAGAMIFVGTHDKTERAPELAEQARERSEAHATNSAPVGAEPKATASETAASGSAVTTSEPVPAEANAGSAARGDQVAEPEKPAGNVAGDARPAAPVVEQGTAVGKIAKKPIATKGRGKAGLTDELTKFKGRSAQDTPDEGNPGGATPWRGKPVKGKLSGYDGELPTGKPSKQGVRASTEDQPELNKSSLSSDDIERGMTAVAGKAKACFAGSQGTATVQLTVAPSGRVQKATVTGLFAGTSTGACVEQAVRAATFPPFDGEPQNFAYDYLISH